MIRGLWFFVQLALVVLAAVFLAEQRGPVSIEWRGWRLDTSVGVMALLVFGFAVALLILWRAFRWLQGRPHAIGRMRAQRRRSKGQAALIRSLAAMAAGDPATALRYASDAEAISDPALAHLAAAQAAEATGNRVRAEAEYDRLRGRPDTALIGLRGLIGLAETAGDTARAIALAKDARKIAPKSPWAAGVLVALQGGMGAYDDAERSLADAAKLGALPPVEADRMLARLLLARGLEAEGADRATEALGHAERAHRLDPSLTGAAVLASRLLARSGRLPAAERILTESWGASPDAALAEAWMALAAPGDTTGRLKQAERLRGLAHDSAEARMALAEAELLAGRWADARAHLTPTDGGGAPTKRYCWMMAYLENATGNEAAARGWLEKSLHAAEDPRPTALEPAIAA